MKFGQSPRAISLRRKHVKDVKHVVCIREEGKDKIDLQNEIQTLRKQGLKKDSTLLKQNTEHHMAQQRFKRQLKQQEILLTTNCTVFAQTKIPSSKLSKTSADSDTTWELENERMELKYIIKKMKTSHAKEIELLIQNQLSNPSVVEPTFLPLQPQQEELMTLRENSTALEERRTQWEKEKQRMGKHIQELRKKLHRKRDKIQDIQQQLHSTKYLLEQQKIRNESLQTRLHQHEMRLNAIDQAEQAQKTMKEIHKAALYEEVQRQANFIEDRNERRGAQHTASTKLQSKVRGNLERKRYQAKVYQRHIAAIHIQKHAKGRQGKAQYTCILQSRINAATLLQRMQRGRLVRSNNKQQQQAAVQIQCRYRGGNGRILAAQKRKEWEYYCNLCALKIQKHLRGWMCRKKRLYIQEREMYCALWLQKHYRGSLAREYYWTFLEATIAVQSVFRGRQGRKMYLQHLGDMRYNERKPTLDVMNCTFLKQYMNQKEQKEQSLAIRSYVENIIKVVAERFIHAKKQVSHRALLPQDSTAIAHEENPSVQQYADNAIDDGSALFAVVEK